MARPTQLTRNCVRGPLLYLLRRTFCSICTNSSKMGNNSKLLQGEKVAPPDPHRRCLEMHALDLYLQAALCGFFSILLVSAPPAGGRREGASFKRASSAAHSFTAAQHQHEQDKAYKTDASGNKIFAWLAREKNMVKSAQLTRFDPQIILLEFSYACFHRSFQKVVFLGSTNAHFRFEKVLFLSCIWKSSK